MLKKLMILPIAAGMLAVNAGAAVTPTPAASMPKTDDGNCYKITTVQNLYGFAAIVNGGETTACAVVTANITDNSNLLEKNGNLSSTRNKNTWTPIKDFAGSFDGGNKTISGLYVKTGNGAGLFNSVQGGATIKNVNLADSYFRVDDFASGLVATVNPGDGSVVTIDNCSFSGTVAGGTDGKAAENIGGLVGVVNTGAKLNLTNSYNDGQVFASLQSNICIINGCGESMKEGNYIGGLIGKVAEGASVKIDNCYNSGKVDAHGGSNQSAIASAENEDDLTLENVYCVNSGNNSGSCPSELVKDLSTIQTLVEQNKNVQAEAAALADLGLKGVVVKAEDGKKVATIDAMADELYIPQDIEVAKVSFDRTFDNTMTSTVMLPFSIAASKVGGAELFNVIDLDSDGAVAETEAETIEAYKPYLVQAANATVTFDGTVTLKASPSAEEVSYTIGDWSFRSRLSNKVWTAETVDGKAYTYSPIAVKDAEGNTTVAKNQFAKIGKNVRVRTMRSYLYYTGSSVKPLGKVRAGASLMSAGEIAVEDLPASIPVRFIHKDIVVEKIVEPEEEEIATIEGDSEEVQAIAKPIMTPAMVKSNRWFDLKGRRLNSKPTAHGTYINNDIPVVVK